MALARKMRAHTPAQCYRDDEVLAFHMQNDTTEEYVQWLRRGCKELTGPVTPKPIASLPAAADCSTPTSQRKTARTSARCVCFACGGKALYLTHGVAIAATRRTARAQRLRLPPALPHLAQAFCRAFR